MPERILDPRRLFYKDGHGAATERNNRPFNPPSPRQHEDLTALQAARDYIADNKLDSGYLVLESSGTGQYRWAVKIRGQTRWRSVDFNLASGMFKEGTRLPFPDPPSQ